MNAARCVVQCMLFDVNIIVRDICRNRIHRFTLEVAMIESSWFYVASGVSECQKEECLLQLAHSVCRKCY